MTADPNEVFRGKWASEVGRFVMAFGSIEGITYAALRHLLADALAQSLIDANLSLSPRLDVLIAITKDRHGPEWVTFASVLGKIKVLSKKRNLIAHNGVGLDVFVDASGEYHFEESISNAKKRRPIQKVDLDRLAFADLASHREEAEALNNQLLASLMAVLDPSSREKLAGP